MPLSADGWFDSDSGHALPPQRNYRPAAETPQRVWAQPLADPVPAAILPAEAWKPPRISWRESPPSVGLPWLTILAGPTAAIFDQGGASVAPRRSWRASEHAGLVPLPVGVSSDGLSPWPQADTTRRRVAATLPDTPPSWVPLPQGTMPGLPLAGGDTALLSRRPRLPTHEPATAPLGPGGAIVANGWLNDAPAVLLRPQRRPAATEAAFVEIVGVADVPVSLIGWRNDTPPMRRQTPSWRAPADPTVIAPPGLADAGSYAAALQAPGQPWLPPRWRAAESPPGFVSLAFAAVLHALAVATENVRWPAPRRAAAEGAAYVAAPSGIVTTPWLPVESGAPPRPSVPGWRHFVPEFAAPPWQTAGVIVVRGPYVTLAGDIYTAGSIEGQAESP